MDRWKFFDISHKFHTLMNPLSDHKIDELISLIGISDGSKVLDIACGKGEFLIRLAKKAEINATGVDLSPYAIEIAKERTVKSVPNSQIKYIESDGKTYLETVTDKFSLCSCMGASWIFGNHKETLKALANFTLKGGIVIAGEPFWIKEPTQWYLDKAKIKYDDFRSHAQNIEIGEELGLRPIYALVSNLDEWDRYEKLQWLGADDHVINNPEDPDNEELLAKVSENRIAYIREGRDVLGWALYVFRKLD